LGMLWSCSKHTHFGSGVCNGYQAFRRPPPLFNLVSTSFITSSYPLICIYIYTYTYIHIFILYIYAYVYIHQLFVTDRYIHIHICMYLLVYRIYQVFSTEWASCRGGGGDIYIHYFYIYVHIHTHTHTTIRCFRASGRRLEEATLRAPNSSLQCLQEHILSPKARHHSLVNLC